MARKVLYIATNASAGMRHFVVSILKTMFEDNTIDCYAILLSELQNDYQQDIPQRYWERVYFGNAPVGKFSRILTLFYPRELLKLIGAICQKHQIETLHFLTEDPCISSIVKRLKTKYTLFYTVHDLDPHEIQFRGILHKKWFEWSHRNRVVKLMNEIDNLVTCSYYQYACLLERYPNKNIGYHVFPSLVTDNVKAGGKKIRELEGVKNYILFFGRIEKYKGVDFLCKAFKQSSELENEILVVAGKGNVCFEYEKIKNVIYLNRFILDEEIRDLFENAKGVVLPYISATQSGLFSFCFYFNKPVVASNIPFFREFAGIGSVCLFEPGNMGDLIEKLKIMGNDIYQYAGNEYECIYGENVLKQSLLKLYKV